MFETKTYVFIQIDHGACIFATTRSDNEIASEKCEYKLDDIYDVGDDDDDDVEGGFDEEER